jgi:hypothetical protein
MSPDRPLLLALGLWFICSVLYWVFVHASDGGALYHVYAQAVDANSSIDPKVRRILAPEFRKGRRWWGAARMLWQELRLFGTAMRFSLMCALNLGFRDMEFGRWLRMLTRKEFDIKATGWARVVSGWQSLLTVYLLALWALTYFTRPFE